LFHLKTSKVWYKILIVCWYTVSILIVRVANTNHWGLFLYNNKNVFVIVYNVYILTSRWGIVLSLLIYTVWFWAAVYICIYVYMYICLYVYMSICIYVYMYICLGCSVYMSICLYVYMSICLYVYMYICLYVYMSGLQCGLSIWLIPNCSNEMNSIIWPSKLHQNVLNIMFYLWLHTHLHAW